MKTGRAILVGVPAVLLAACLAGIYATEGVMASLPFLHAKNDAAATGLVDQRPWQTVVALAPLAVSAEEQEFAREAERLADHEVDAAFAMALRHAEMETRTLTGDALALQQKVAALAAQVAEDQAKVDALTAKTTAARKSGVAVAGPVANELDLANAQLQLDTDQWNDASEDLARATGDERGRIQRELTARQAAMKQYASQAGGGQVAVISAKRNTTLAARIKAWRDQRSRQELIEQAKAETDAEVAALTKEHAEIDAKADASMAAMHEAGPATKASMGMMATAHMMAQVHSIVDDRLQTEQQLSAVYAKWIAQVELQHRIVTHMILDSLAAIAGLMLAGALPWWVTQTVLDRSSRDQRSLHTLRTISTMVLQVVVLGAVLLVIFGPPMGVSTMLGLTAAGLIVVFQDFILAFFGWFVLMGKSGIRVGDWVEINGVGGEVVEIGLFRTTLFESGNWSNKGYPTGRRVSFMNSYAISGKYFNFSTAGQWMWDEISVTVPAGEDAYKTIEAIHREAIVQTEADARLAEAEWKTATKQRLPEHFSAAASVDMRPVAAGIDLLVRYVTRANDRFAIRNKLYEAVIGLLHQPKLEDPGSVRTA